MRGTSITGRKADHLPVFHCFETNNIRERENGHQVEERPGVAVEAGRMIGFVAGDSRASQNLSWIATIAVLPEYQRRGIGRALLLACETQLSTPRVRLCVRTDNVSAIRLYEQEGYQRIDIWYRYYKDKSDALVMEKEIERGEGYNRLHA